LVTVHAPPDATLDPQLFLSVAEGIDAVNCDPPTNVVVRGLPFHFTTAPETNPVPLTVSVKAGLPGATLVGTSGCFTNGTGFCPKVAPERIPRHISDTMNFTGISFRVRLVLQDSFRDETFSKTGPWRADADDCTAHG